uniref:WAP domain-containing protein n=1 Tax=Trichuris muris TaxID=70415 RepID=A0A5S6Q854_TRIMR
MRRCLLAPILTVLLCQLAGCHFFSQANSKLSSLWKKKKTHNLPQKCPKYVDLPQAKRFCTSDRECPVDMMCCHSNGFRTCVPAMNMPKKRMNTRKLKNNTDLPQSLHRPGQCPHVSHVYKDFLNTCAIDLECPLQYKCCHGPNGTECVRPMHRVITKKGLCPNYQPTPGNILESCKQDSDCKTMRKCCLVENEYKCVEPDSTEPQSWNTKLGLWLKRFWGFTCSSSCESRNL